MAVQIIIGARLGSFNTPGAMGVVTDTRYVKCFWPLLDQPFSPFAEGSSGIEVEGPPTPRNILFPLGTIFLNGARGDCFFEVTEPEQDGRRMVTRIETVTIRGVPRLVSYEEEEAVRQKVRTVRELSRAEAEGRGR